MSHNKLYTTSLDQAPLQEYLKKRLFKKKIHKYKLIYPTGSKSNQEIAISILKIEYDHQWSSILSILFSVYQKNPRHIKIKNRKVQLDKWTNSLYAHGSPNLRPVPNSKLLTPHLLPLLWSSEWMGWLRRHLKAPGGEPSTETMVNRW